MTAHLQNSGSVAVSDRWALLKRCYLNLVLVVERKMFRLIYNKYVNKLVKSK